MKTLFMGTPDFALPCLKMLVDEGYNVTGVVTQPDRPKGRGKRLTESPIKKYAKTENIKIYQPENLKGETIKKCIQECDPEIIIVVAYGQILPKHILNYPPYGCINVHASLLPKYRGAGPIQWAIINGDKYTGVTTMYMDEGMDTGDIILKKEVIIEDNETAELLHDKLSIIGKDLLKDTIKLIKKGIAPRQKQDEEQASYAPMLDKSMGKINWEKPALQIKNLIRGVNPWPCAYTKYKDKIIKIWSVDIEECKGIYPAGTIVDCKQNKGIFVKTGDNRCLIIREMQIQGRKRMAAAECMRGYIFKVGEKFD